MQKLVSRAVLQDKEALRVLSEMNGAGEILIDLSPVTIFIEPLLLTEREYTSSHQHFINLASFTHPLACGDEVLFSQRISSVGGSARSSCIAAPCPRSKHRIRTDLRNRVRSFSGRVKYQSQNRARGASEAICGESTSPGSAIKPDGLTSLELLDAYAHIIVRRTRLFQHPICGCCERSTV